MPAPHGRLDEMAFLAPVHVASAYFVFVAIDTEGRPRAVPPLRPETDDEERRICEAEIRNAHRLSRKQEIASVRRGDQVG